MAIQTSAIRLEGVTKCYGAVTALESVSFEVERGEFLTLLGPSGSGKTTLLRVIAGLERPDAGRVYLGGEDVTELPPYRRRVHTVFQQYVLFPHLNVYKNVAFGLEQKRLSRREIARRVGAALELVRLSGYERRWPHELSGGEQQRVALARALVLEPEALLLDEPLAALDLQLRKEMQRELKRLQREVGISFLLVTHDQEEALALSDRIAVIADGRLQQIGTPREVYERPETAFVATFLGAANVLEAEILHRENGDALLGLCGHTVRVPLNGRRIEGSRAQVAIRPEKIALRARPLRRTDLVQLEGVIEERLYLGEATHWRVRVGEHYVTVTEPNRPGSKTDAFRDGQRVFLCWARESIVVLSR
ncbi:MAG: ABC transporter ATP-binding protein [Blastocatellia bacterium]|nr:ABC transporter ATP-binding protein [Blastocatellia bacterium]MCS7157440.1 ABC transporter ATP-binding protein [Blastocatellia bacterium]MCX7752613.1 ABC transporter ATP-binding protein [Blastocatellia bacterium]MDW8168344.1 ABC transporter ATP-binding protein [Acidobacteriota bacterium]MDW8255540.1 ABC transporter ATP-binding protein [Acidobacteriota bacterium]